MDRKSSGLEKFIQKLGKAAPSEQGDLTRNVYLDKCCKLGLSYIVKKNFQIGEVFSTERMCEIFDCRDARDLVPILIRANQHNLSFELAANTFKLISLPEHRPKHTNSPVYNADNAKKWELTLRAVLAKQGKNEFGLSDIMKILEVNVDQGANIERLFERHSNFSVKKEGRRRRFLV